MVNSNIFTIMNHLLNVLQILSVMVITSKSQFLDTNARSQINAGPARQLRDL